MELDIKLWFWLKLNDVVGVELYIIPSCSFLFILLDVVIKEEFIVDSRFNSNGSSILISFILSSTQWLPKIKI